jgi:hypothetical protein
MAKSTLTQGDVRRDTPNASSPKGAPLREPNRPLLKPTHLAPAASNNDKKS